MPNDIAKKVMHFYDQIVKDNNHRYKSWEHCYLHFTGENADKDINLSCLHLAFYLASWGMYRGSSFLLQKDYLVHKPVVELVLENTDFQKLSFSSINDTELEQLVALFNKLKNCYGKASKATDTLITKIMLGTLGCVPAFDQYFIDGIRKSNLKYSVFNLACLKRIVDYYTKNKKQFDAVQKKIHKKSKIDYPAMKLVDMYFWEIGFQKGKVGENEWPQ